MGRTQQASVDGSVSKKFNLNRGGKGSHNTLMRTIRNYVSFNSSEKNSKAAAVIKNNRNVRA